MLRALPQIFISLYLHLKVSFRKYRFQLQLFSNLNYAIFSGFNGNLFIELLTFRLRWVGAPPEGLESTWHLAFAKKCDKDTCLGRSGGTFEFRKITKAGSLTCARFRCNLTYSPETPFPRNVHLLSPSLPYQRIHNTFKYTHSESVRCFIVWFIACRYSGIR